MIVIASGTLHEGTPVMSHAYRGGSGCLARVARAHGVNANLVFNWCRRYRAGRLGGGGEAKLLPVRVTAESSTALALASQEPGSVQTFSSSTIHTQLQHAQVRVEGSPDPVLMRVLLECLQR